MSFQWLSFFGSVCNSILWARGFWIYFWEKSSKVSPSNFIGNFSLIPAVLALIVFFFTVQWFPFFHRIEQLFLPRFCRKFNFNLKNPKIPPTWHLSYLFSIPHPSCTVNLFKCKFVLCGMLLHFRGICEAMREFSIGHYTVLVLTKTEKKKNFKNELQPEFAKFELFLLN